MDYSYPIDISWSQEEMVYVVEFLNVVENAYENAVTASVVKEKYDLFKKVVAGKADENNLYKDFKKVSGYDGYLVVKQMKDMIKDNPTGKISIKL